MSSAAPSATCSSDGRSATSTSSWKATRSASPGGSRAGSAASLRTHERFGTATLSAADGRTLDVAAARSETYPRPGALPVVSLGASLDERTCARRDFTVHAMAIPLEGLAPADRPLRRPRRPEAPAAPDPAPGALSRTTRRASCALARYASRLGFGVDAGRGAASREALADGALETISADRLRREVRLLLEEENRAGDASGGFERSASTAPIHPALRSRPGAGPRLSRAEALAARAASDVGWLCYLLAWMGEATAEEARSLADRLGLAGDEAAARPRVARVPRTDSRAAVGPTAPRRRGARRRVSRRTRSSRPLGRPGARGAAIPRGGPPAGNAARRSAAPTCVAAGVPAGPASAGHSRGRARPSRTDGSSAARSWSSPLRCAREDGP